MAKSQNGGKQPPKKTSSGKNYGNIYTGSPKSHPQYSGGNLSKKDTAIIAAEKKKHFEEKAKSEAKTKAIIAAEKKKRFGK